MTKQTDITTRLLQTPGYAGTRDDAIAEITKLRAATSSAEYHQMRGAAWDIIDEAIITYDRWMLDDDYDASKLHEIMKRMKERRALYHGGSDGQSTDSGHGD